MVEIKRYRSVVFDSARWDGFRFRDDDILICTPAKCGTTWMQMLCAMLVFDAVEFDRPLAAISPWLDMQTTALDTVVGALQAQEHRRLIKTHTPLDGLPHDDRVSYVCVGRDPRDAALSFEHHLANIDYDAFMAARAAAVGLADIAELDPPPPAPSADPADRFWEWADGEGSGIRPTLASVLQHLQTFWDRRAEPNVALFHYGDLLADLLGQLRRLAGVLGIDVTDGKLIEFAEAATFTGMKQRAQVLAPNSEDGFCLDHSH